MNDDPIREQIFMHWVGDGIMTGGEVEGRIRLAARDAWMAGWRHALSYGRLDGPCESATCPIQEAHDHGWMRQQLEMGRPLEAVSQLPA